MKAHVGQEIPPIANQAPRPVRELHALLTIVSAVADEYFGSPNFTEEFVRLLSISGALDLDGIDEGEVRIELLYLLDEIAECWLGVVHPHSYQRCQPSGMLRDGFSGKGCAYRAWYPKDRVGWQSGPLQSIW